MFKLTVELKTLEELTAFVAKMGGDVLKGKVELAPVPPVIMEEPVGVTESVTKEKTKAKKAPKVVEEEMIDVPSPFVAAPTVQKAPEVVVPSRQELLGRINAGIDTLKKSGIPQEQIMPQIQQVYADTGITPKAKLGELDDTSLARFVPAFENKVIAITGASQSHSYI